MTRKSGERPCFTHPRGRRTIRPSIFRGTFASPLLFVSLACAFTALGAESGTLGGTTVTDPLGAVVVSATVQLLDGPPRPRKPKPMRPALSLSGAEIRALPGAGDRAHFQSTTSNAVFVAAFAPAKPGRYHPLDPNEPNRLRVTATGTLRRGPGGAAGERTDRGSVPVPTEVQDPVRLIPGVQVTQTGRSGGTTGLSIRGGNINANKMFIDGVPLTI